MVTIGRRELISCSAARLLVIFLPDPKPGDVVGRLGQPARVRGPGGTVRRRQKNHS